MPRLTTPQIVTSIPESTLTLVDSRTTNINNGTSWESATFIDIRKYVSITMTITADRNLTVDFEFSSDGSNIDGVHSEAYVANAKDAFDVPVIARYFKIKVSNASGGNTTTFRGYVWGKTQ